MFARSFRPAARAVRSARIARSYTATPVVRAQPQTWKGVTASSEEEAEREGGKILLMVGGAFGALFTIGSILAEQRKNRVHPSEPKEEVEEEVEEAAEEEVAEEAGVVETISAAADAALTAIETSVAAVDAELDALVAAAEAALGKSAAPAPAAAALPDPNQAASEGAFNEETGEINWDCPCLGGMAHGPCGEEFKAAFSCFVYSEQEPKGIDCVEKFKGMQECFRAHPDVYAEEIDDDEEAQAEAAKEDNKE